MARGVRSAGGTWTLGVLLILLAACGPSAEPPAEVRVGVIAPFDGPLSAVGGLPVRDAARWIAEQTNARGGLEIGGLLHRVEVFFEDSQNSPQVSVDAVRRLINQRRVHALVGPCFSHNAIPAAALAEQQRIPMISPTANHRGVTLGKRFVFQVSPLSESQGEAIARFAWRELGAHTAAALYDVTTAYNRDLAESFRRGFEGAGGRLAAFETYTAGQRDHDAAMARIRDSAPDVLLLPNYNDEVPGQVEQAREAEVAATFLGGDTWNSTYADSELFEGAYFVDSWHRGITEPKSERFVEDFRSAFGVVPNGAAALTYDAFELLFEAIASRGSLDGESIRDGLAGVRSHQGVTGSISYPDGGVPVRSLVIVEIIGGESRFRLQIEP